MNNLVSVGVRGLSVAGLVFAAGVAVSAPKCVPCKPCGKCVATVAAKPCIVSQVPNCVVCDPCAKRPAKVLNPGLYVQDRETLQDGYTNASLKPVCYANYLKKLPSALWNLLPLTSSYSLPQYTGEGHTRWSMWTVADTNPGPKLYKWTNHLAPKQSGYPAIYRDGAK